MKEKKLTIFTPTYNRAHTIRRTYESLCRQTCKDFEWLIVDDGSTDSTKDLVQSWISENIIPIRYIYQENQGMHGAHNTAYHNITTELNTCIDSDDYMPDNAVELIINLWRKKGGRQYAGIIGLDQDVQGNIIGTKFSEKLKTTTLTGFYAAGGDGDKKQVYCTEVINSYPDYPVFDGEKYVGLNYKYMLIDQDYTLLTLNEPLVIVDYQSDGSSFSMYRQYWNNPKGFAFLRKTEMTLTKSWQRRFICCIHYVSSSIRARNRRFIQESPKKFETILAIPFGILLYGYLYYKVKRSASYSFR